MTDQDPIEGEIIPFPPPSHQEDPHAMLWRPTLGALLVHLRRQVGWSQDDLAQQTGYTQDGISKIEGGHRKPYTTTLRRFVEAFNNAGLDISLAHFEAALQNTEDEYAIEERWNRFLLKLSTEDTDFQDEVYRAVMAIYEAMQNVKI